MKPLRIILTPMLGLLLLVSVTFAQGSYDLSWWTVDGGGQTFSNGGDYTLGGAIGQPDAGLLTGGDYTLGGGFWGGGEVGEAEEHSVYLPLVMRD